MVFGKQLGWTFLQFLYGSFRIAKLNQLLSLMRTDREGSDTFIMVLLL